MRAVLRICTLVGVAAVTVIMVVARSDSYSGGHQNSSATLVQSAPPAVSSEDNTVSLDLWLADSFDILADGHCLGRSDNKGMFNGAHVLLRGTSTAWDVETKAFAFYVQRLPEMYRGKPGLVDDYRYCHVWAVFKVSLPDPEGYSIKFQRAAREMLLGKTGRTRFGRPERPGYGNLGGTVQTCPNLSDPPEMNC